jgi:cation diffusion facilitator CzcD-associated flavoprotein CzcO
MTTESRKKRLAIIGCGSSGLVTLKMALEFLPDWEVIAFEKSDSIRGCWGNPYPGFVSTSTKFTTQFACFPKWKATMNPEGRVARDEFFRESEYGDYLEEFADVFKLRVHIRMGTCIKEMRRSDSVGWILGIEGADDSLFDAVVICTGLVAKARLIESNVPCLSPADLADNDRLEQIRHKTIVVLGGGESAVDYANRLARKELKNAVYLSVRSGVRVSPRYHPVRGVPSDFLRNRLMLSADPAVRNWLGQIFVLARIRYQRWFERVFPSVQGDGRKEDSAIETRKALWAQRLTLAAKDDLFNMFHNKSDDFLQAVAEERISIIGPSINERFERFRKFGTNVDSETEEVRSQPDYIVPAIGFQSTLGKVASSALRLEDFFLGCCHKDFDDTWAVGFARPIIGNIPSISEMQARYVCGMIAGEFKRPSNLSEAHRVERRRIASRYKHLDVDTVYPVEMFPYCDQLAKKMGLPIGSRWLDSPLRWWRQRVAPATTMHYFDEDSDIGEAPVYMPILLICLILIIKPFDWLYKMLVRLRG